jgi:cytochrome P450
MHSMPSMDDPYPSWSTFRDMGSLIPTTTPSLWAAVDQASVSAVASNTRSFSSAVGLDRNPSEEFLLTLDPPRHSRDRQAFLAAFQVPLATLRDSCSRIACDVAEDIPDTDAIFDIDAAYSRPFTSKLWNALLRDPTSDTEYVRDALEHIANGEHPQHFLDHVFRTASSPFSALYDLQIEEVPASELEARISMLAIALLVAMCDTLAAGITLCLAQALPASESGQSGLSGQLSADALLRVDTPLQGLFRKVQSDVELCGVQLIAGDVIQLCWGSANHDLGSPSFTFGFGPHRCPGRSLSLAACDASILALRESGVTQVDQILKFRDHPHMRIPSALLVRRRST